MILNTLYLIVYRWFLHWLKLLESLCGILTLGFYSPHLVTPGCIAILDHQSRYVASQREERGTPPPPTPHKDDPTLINIGNIDNLRQ